MAEKDGSIEASSTDFDLTPNPRILAMLGEINLPQWRCISELIDNSIDAFLNSRNGQVNTYPQVFVTLPSLDNEQARVSIRDNGVGMDAMTLQNAVRAGWTGNATFDNLGFYGMGLKIAMARLGSVTTVWSTRKGDAECIGVGIDFAKLQRQGHFRTPKITKPKNDVNSQGTEITIDKLKPEQRQWFAKSINRSSINRQLSRVYSSMLRPNGKPLSFELQVNRTKIEARNHCIWGGEDSSRREVSTARYGVINAYQTIDTHLPDRPCCMRCLQWCSSSETNCSNCGMSDAVLQRQRRVHGWLGIQRYVHTSDYGIDFLRHGRKIEMSTKDLFEWVREDSSEEEWGVPRRLDSFSVCLR